MGTYMWKEELIEHLIMLWEQHQVLYASFTTDPKCKKQRLEALEEIYVELSLVDENITMEIVKMKLHLLRSQFCKEFKRLKEYARRGLKVVPKMEWYGRLMFLQHSVEGKPVVTFAKPSTAERAAYASPAKKLKLPVENTSDEDYVQEDERTDADNEERESEAIHDWLEKKIDDLKAKLDKQREYKAAAKIRSKIKKETDDVEEMHEDMPQKRKSFKWLSDQVVFELNELHSDRLQEDAAWAIQKILHETLEMARTLPKNRKAVKPTIDDKEAHNVSFKQEIQDEDSRMSIEQLFLEHFD